MVDKKLSILIFILCIFTATGMYLIGYKKGTDNAYSIASTNENTNHLAIGLPTELLIFKNCSSVSAYYKLCSEQDIYPQIGD